MLQGFVHPNLIQLGNIRMQHEDQFCSNVYMLQYFYEYVERDLQEEIIIKQRQELKFSQSQILTAMSQMVDALRYLLTKNIHHESIMPKTVLLDQSMNVKLYVPNHMTGQTHYKKLMLRLEEECYLPPELFNQLVENNISPAANLEQADVFGVGLTGLQMANLTDLNQVYDFTSKQFNDTLLSEKLQCVADQYSPELATLLQELMLIDPLSRPDLSAASEKISALMVDVS